MDIKKIEAIYESIRAARTGKLTDRNDVLLNMAAFCVENVIHAINAGIALDPSEDLAKVRIFVTTLANIHPEGPYKEIFSEIDRQVKRHTDYVDSEITAVLTY